MPQDALPTISLVISTYNNPVALNEILRRIEKGTELPEQLLISDDGSGEETRELVGRWKKESALDIVHCWHEDAGFRKTRVLNMAASRATGDYLLFLDGDCLPSVRFVGDHRKLAETGYFVQGRRAFIAEEAVSGLLSGKDALGALVLKGKVSGLAKAIRWPLPVVRRNRGHRGLIGCNLAIWRSDYEAVNGYDESFEGWGKEDSDLCIRLYNHGLERKFVYGRGLVFHLNHPVADRARLAANRHRLQETIEARRVRCDNGLNLHADRPAPFEKG